MEAILITGAAGDVGARLRRLLKGVYPRIRISDIRKPSDIGSDEEFIAADLADYGQVEKITSGIEGIVHLGGFSVEGPWETIHRSNIVGCYNLFEAAPTSSRKRSAFAEVWSPLRAISIGREAGRIRILQSCRRILST